MRRKPLVEEIHRIIENKPSWGCEMVREILGNKGITVSHNRMHRLWKAEKLQVSRHKTRRKLRTDARLNPVPTGPISVGVRTSRGPSWRTKDVRLPGQGRGDWICLTSKARSSWKGVEVRTELNHLAAIHGLPGPICSDSGGRYISRAMVGWAAKHRLAQAFIVLPGLPWENGAAESLVATPRRECLDVKLFGTLAVGQIHLERWRRIYNDERPHCRSCGKPPESVRLAALKAAA